MPYSKRLNVKGYVFLSSLVVSHLLQDLTVSLGLNDDQGNSMPAMEVFSKSIEYLKDHFLSEFENIQKDKLIKVKPEDIHWVLTVPAIWDERAKRFMREAAINVSYCW